MTVNPKAAPKVTIRTRMPPRAVLPTSPLCSIEKKKYNEAATVNRKEEAARTRPAKIRQ